MGKFEKGDVVLLAKTIKPEEEAQRLNPYKIEFLTVLDVKNVDGLEECALSVPNSDIILNVKSTNLHIFKKHSELAKDDIDQSVHENIYFG